MKKKKILVVFGTRPEAIKLAPVIAALKKERSVNCRVCFTGQHYTMAKQVIDFFKIKVDISLNVMKKGQTLEYLTKTMVPKVGEILDKEKPDWVVIQGDTTTVFLVALAAFYKKIKVAHVEAGLRTYNKYYPFPEEINRKLTASVTDLHFAPTEQAKKNLLQEGFSKKDIFKTGNTSIDALLWACKLIKKSYKVFDKIDFKKKIILVTAHRRESFGKPLEEMLKALVDIVQTDPNIEIIYPAHFNPNVQEKVNKILRGKKGIRLFDPVPYDQLVYLMRKCTLILTDSGGIQEEAPSLRKPVLVMRDETERPEGVKLGVSKLVGRTRKKIAQETLKLLSSPKAYKKMVKGKNPYGDGKASQRIMALFKAS